MDKFAVFTLVFGFCFVEQKLGEYSFIGHIQDLFPFCNVAASQ